LSEVDETSILKLGLPDPLHLLSQLVTAHSGRRPIGSCARLSGLSRSDFVHCIIRRLRSKLEHKPTIVKVPAEKWGRPSVIGVAV
jgi:hypothetical protein